VLICLATVDMSGLYEYSTLPIISQAERQKGGQEPVEQTGCKARVNRIHSNGTIAPSRKLFPELFNAAHTLKTGSFGKSGVESLCHVGWEMHCIATSYIACYGVYCGVLCCSVLGSG
jgi:hypothetical protein